VRGGWRKLPAGIEVRLRVTPRANADAIAGCHVDSNDQVSLAVKVRALPGKGAANAAVIATLAKALNIPRSMIALASGAAARSKTVRIAGDADALERAIAALAGDKKET